MHHFAIALGAGVFTFLFALLGMFVQKLLPEAHLTSGARDMISAVMGLVALLLALVLGTLVGSAYGFFAIQKANVETLGARAVQLDMSLEQFGPQTSLMRRGLRLSVQSAHHAIWESDDAEAALQGDGFLQGLKALNLSAAALSPDTPLQKALIGSIASNAGILETTRLMMVLQLASPISWPLLGIVVSWAMLLFCGYGVLSRFNGTAVAAAFIGAFAVGSAVFLILELNSPFTGMFRIPDGSVVETIKLLGDLN
jgi:hypothetical protein